MEVKTVAVSDVKPYPNNPRHNEDAVAKVAASIREFGFQQPIVVDKDGFIVVGHTRFEAAKSLGLSEVPITVADNLTDEQVKAYRLADNKTNEFAEWDFEKLLEELNDVSMDMSEFGFVDLDIEWGDVPELEENTYEPPKHDMIRCPKCGHVDRKEHFVKVDEEVSEDEEPLEQEGEE